MATSRDTLRAVFPELDSAHTDDELDTFITLAAARLDATTWGSLYLQGVVYLAAHLLTLSDRGAAGASGVGGIQGQKAGDLEVRYGATVGVLSSDATLATTPAGVEYLNLRKLVPMTGFVV